MQIDNPFDKHLEVSRNMPMPLRIAATDLTDVLDLCWKAAQAVFESDARPEHALQLLPQFMQRADAERRKELAKRLGEMDDE